MWGAREPDPQQGAGEGLAHAVARPTCLGANSHAQRPNPITTRAPRANPLPALLVMQLCPSHVPQSRPLTHDLMKSVLDVLGFRITKVWPSRPAAAKPAPSGVPAVLLACAALLSARALSDTARKPPRDEGSRECSGPSTLCRPSDCLGRVVPLLKQAQGTLRVGMSPAPLPLAHLALPPLPPLPLGAHHRAQGQHVPRARAPVAQPRHQVEQRAAAGRRAAVGGDRRGCASLG